MPHSSEVRVNPPTQIMRIRRRPKRFASQPDIGSTMAFDTRYDVTTHVPSSTVAPMLPDKWGMATFTTVVSSTSMNVASITAMVMIHGLIRRLASSGITDAIVERKPQASR